jgi:hypothetical protein
MMMVVCMLFLSEVVEVVSRNIHAAFRKSGNVRDDDGEMIAVTANENRKDTQTPTRKENCRLLVEGSH